jgi:hypothetical protein
MRLPKLLTATLFSSIALSSCGQAKTDKKDQKSKTETSSNANFDLTLDKSFYMTGDAMDDLYISVTINSGEIKTGSEVEIAKKDNPTEKILANVYKIETRKYQKLDAAKAGQEAVLFLKVKNDKGFSLGYTGDLYTLSPKGKTPIVQNTSAAKSNSIIKINGQQWTYENVKVYHYTRDDGKGVTKGPANIMITFTKRNKNVTMTGGEERLQINIYTSDQKPGSYPKSKLDVAFFGFQNGKEVTLVNNKSPLLEAGAEITAYNNSGKGFILSGRVNSVTKHTLCNGCPNQKVEVNFDKLPVEVYNR